MSFSSSDSPIGLIGLGLMGSAFATKLLAHGARVVGFDVDAARMKAFAELGGAAAPTAAELMQRCPRIILSLPSHHEVRAVIDGGGAQLRADHAIIDTTTGDPRGVATLAAELKARGVTYLDATISGNSAQVRKGDAVVLVGGAREAFDAHAALLRELGGEVFHTGPSGTGAKMKLVTNLVLGLNRAVLAEGLAFAEALALDPALTLAIMRRSPAYSRAMDAKGEKMIRGDFVPEARLSQHLKDVRLIVEAGTEGGLPMPLSRTHREILETAEAAGLGGLDNSAIIRVLAAREPNAPVG